MLSDSIQMYNLFICKWGKWASEMKPPPTSSDHSYKEDGKCYSPWNCLEFSLLRKAGRSKQTRDGWLALRIKPPWNKGFSFTGCVTEIYSSGSYGGITWNSRRDATCAAWSYRGLLRSLSPPKPVGITVFRAMHILSLNFENSFFSLEMKASATF